MPGKMTQELATNVMYEPFSDWWINDLGKNESTINLDNTDFSIPDPKTVDEWARVVVRFQRGGRQRSMNLVQRKKRFLEIGFLFVRIAVPTDSGVARLRELGDQARDIYESQRYTPSINGVRYNSITVDNTDFVDDGLADTEKGAPLWRYGLLEVEFSYTYTNKSNVSP